MLSRDAAEFFCQKRKALLQQICMTVDVYLVVVIRKALVEFKHSV
jgi:hypothetical protein